MQKKTNCRIFNYEKKKRNKYFQYIVHIFCLLYLNKKS